VSPVTQRRRTRGARPSSTEAPASLPLKSRLAERVREALRAEIRQGHWRGELPPERRLAQEFEVSRPTLHMALRALQKEGVVQTSPRHPWRVAHQAPHGTVTAARRPEVMLLRYTRVKPDLADLSLVTEPLRQKMHQLGYALKIMDPFARGLKNMDRILSAFDREHRPAFYVLLSVPPQAHRWFVQRGIPAAVSGSREPDVPLPALDMDNEVVMRHATQYLLRRGHRRIAFFNVPIVAGGAAVQEKVFRDTCAAWPTGDVEARLITSPVRPVAVADAVRRAFLRRGRPTALIASDAEQVLGVYSTLATLGLRIPRDVSVLVFGHCPFMDFLNPLPTCYRVSWDQWANRIARVIRNYLRIGVLPTTFAKVMPTLREGKSVATVT